jgi:N,N'-diacetyllegionaminate synthase
MERGVRRLEIAGRHVGADAPLFVIAEIGLNHDGSLDRALTLVDEAARAGVQAIKLQSLFADKLVAASCPAPVHVNVSSLRELFARYELDEAAHRTIAERARRHGLAFISTPFDEGAVDMLERIGVDAVKIASGDLTHHALIARAARTGKPLILSTGLSTLDEVAAAVACARDHGAARIALLHCVSSYPVPDDQQNLGAIGTLADAFDIPIGLSDHSTTGAGLPIAVALGASIYERHLKPVSGEAVLDEAVSSNCAELAAAIQVAALTRKVMGHGRREPQPAEIPNYIPSRRALRAVRDLTPGDIVRHEDVVALRPADGLSPVHRARLIGTRVTRIIRAGDVFLDADLPPAYRPDQRTPVLAQIGETRGAA